MDTMYHDGSRELQDRFDTRRLADRIEEVLVHDFVATSTDPSGSRRRLSSRKRDARRRFRRGSGPIGLGTSCRTKTPHETLAPRSSKTHDLPHRQAA